MSLDVDERLTKLESMARGWPQAAAKISDRLGRLERGVSVSAPQNLPATILLTAASTSGQVVPAIEQETQLVGSDPSEAKPPAHIGQSDHVPDSEDSSSESPRAESEPDLKPDSCGQPLSTLSDQDWVFYSNMLGISVEALKAAKNLPLSRVGSFLIALGVASWERVELHV